MLNIEDLVDTYEIPLPGSWSDVSYSHLTRKQEELTRCSIFSINHPNRRVLSNYSAKVYKYFQNVRTDPLLDKGGDISDLPTYGPHH